MSEVRGCQSCCECYQIGLERYHSTFEWCQSWFEGLKIIMNYGTICKNTKVNTLGFKNSSYILKSVTFLPLNFFQKLSVYSATFSLYIL